MNKNINCDIDYAYGSSLKKQLDLIGLLPSFYMTPSEIFTRNNKNMVNVLNKISLKNIQIVILLLQLHHV